MRGLPDVGRRRPQLSHHENRWPTRCDCCRRRLPVSGLHGKGRSMQYALWRTEAAVAEAPEAVTCDSGRDRLLQDGEEQRAYAAGRGY